MNNQKTIFIVGFILVWLLAIVSILSRMAHHKNQIEPHLEYHASVVASLFFETCLLSNMDPQSIEKGALVAGMKDVSVGTNLPLNSFGKGQILSLWELEAPINPSKVSKYKPYPNQLWTYEAENKKRRAGAKANLRCQLDFHHGVIKSEVRPYDIPRRSFHGEYRRYLGVELLNRLEGNGAEIVDAVALNRDPRKARDPIIYNLEGQTYHMNVRPFSLSLERAR